MATEKKITPVRYVSVAARRSIHRPEEQYVRTVGGVAAIATKHHMPIGFVDGEYLATTQDEIDAIESQADYGTAIMRKSDVQRTISKARKTVVTDKTGQTPPASTVASLTPRERDGDDEDDDEDNTPTPDGGAPEGQGGGRRRIEGVTNKTEAISALNKAGISTAGAKLETKEEILAFAEANNIALVGY